MFWKYFLQFVAYLFILTVSLKSPIYSFLFLPVLKNSALCVCVCVHVLSKKHFPNSRSPKEKVIKKKKNSNALLKIYG